MKRISRKNDGWPVLTRYDERYLLRVALPIGGIGTGTVSLGGRGELRDWELMNRPAKGFTPTAGHGTGPFFAIFVRDGDKTIARALEGAIPPEEYEGGSGCRTPNHGLPHFRRCTFAAAYPFGQVFLSDPAVPVEVRLEAFNPLIPADAERSGIPAAVLRYVLTNKTARSLTASVCGTVINMMAIGNQPKPDAKPIEAANEFRRGKKVRGLCLSADGLDPQAEKWGTLALATTAGRGVTYRTRWANLSWGDSLLDFWDDFSSDGALGDRVEEGKGNAMASLAVSCRLPARGSVAVTFLLTWHFPNRYTWTPKKQADCACSGEKCANPDLIGNYYTSCYKDAWDVAERTAAELPALERDTATFVRAFCDSDLPRVVKEAALYNLSTLRTQTCFRTSDGRFYGWEGCGDGGGCCHGSCTHVWNYEVAVPYLFGDLSRLTREVQFLHATRDDGLMSFRVNLPLSRAQEFALAAADGQMGSLMKLYNDWRLSGDTRWLKRLWPKAKKAIEFCWIPGGWDADRDGVMEGCQHNTMDVEYYGPNPQMGIWYLGALRAAEEMAEAMGDDAFARTCRSLFERGSRWIDENLFNGEYYEHHVAPPRDESAIAPGLRIGAGARNLKDPELQLGSGCLVDQLVGQYLAHVCGLGHLVEPDKARKTLQSILKHNFKKGFFGHFNHLRSFVLGEESALLMATYPRGRRPKRPFPYYNEVMTGFEYCAAVHMLYEGQIRDGLKVIQAIRDRYDGRKRSPFNEAECGHHYARAMASWSAVLALTGFHYCGVGKHMTFAARSGTFFWSNGSAWGTFTQKVGKRGARVTLRVLFGELTLSRLRIEGVGEKVFPQPLTLSAGRSGAWTVPASST